MNDNQTYEVRNRLGTGIFKIEKKGEEYILLEYEGNDEKVEIPEEVTSIRDNAFQANIRLKKIKHGKITYSIDFFNYWGYGNIIDTIIKKKDKLPILIPNNIVAENTLKKIFSKLEDDEIANFISICDEENFIKNVDLLQKCLMNMT